MVVRVKRVYEPPDKADGQRILVDRLWPRGVSKEKAQLDLWLKDVAPSTELRVWFGHKPEKWQRFRRRYETELRKNKELVRILADKAKNGAITLVYAARDERHNEALVLKQFLDRAG